VDGFTLIEVLVAALITILIAGATASALIATGHFAGDQRFRSQADSVAAQDMDRLRGLSDEQLNGLNQTRTVTLGSTPFTVQSTATYLDTTGASSCSSTAAAYYKIYSTVSWPEGFSSRPATMTDQAILSRPVSGDLLTQVTDQTGAGLSGVSVNPTGPSNQTAQTDNNGCVLFAGLTPGAYTINVSDSGYVDPNGNTTSTGTATVNSTGVAHAINGTFHLGLGGTLTGVFTTPVTGAGGEADGLSYTGTGSAYGMSAPAVVPSCTTCTLATSVAASHLFPFDGTSGYTGNYSLWAGRCTQMEPPTPTPGTVNPGSSGSVNVTEPALDVGTVYYKSSSGATAQAVTPGHIKLTFTGTTCSDSWYPELASSLSATTGWLKYPGQPYMPSGTLSVCADYKPSGSSYTYQASQPAANTTMTSGSVNSVPTITITKVTSTNPLAKPC
jgi:Tfp pilus assembly protein PilV